MLMFSFNTDLLPTNVEFTNVDFGTLLWIFFPKIIAKNEAKHCFLHSWKNSDEPSFNFSFLFCYSYSTLSRK